MTMMTTVTVTVDELMQAAEAARVRGDLPGYFAIHLWPAEECQCHVMHWFKPDAYASKKNETVFAGTAAEFVAAPDEHVAAYKRRVAAQHADTREEAA